jgi:hypothetical protein
MIAQHYALHPNNRTNRNSTSGLLLLLDHNCAATAPGHLLLEAEVAVLYLTQTARAASHLRSSSSGIPARATTLLSLPRLYHCSVKIAEGVPLSSPESHKAPRPAFLGQQLLISSIELESTILRFCSIIIRCKPPLQGKQKCDRSINSKAISLRSRYAVPSLVTARLRRPRGTIPVQTRQTCLEILEYHPPPSLKMQYQMRWRKL